MVEQNYKNIREKEEEIKNYWIEKDMKETIKGLNEKQHTIPKETDIKLIKNILCTR